MSRLPANTYLSRVLFIENPFLSVFPIYFSAILSVFPTFHEKQLSFHSVS